MDGWIDGILRYFRDGIYYVTWLLHGKPLPSDLIGLNHGIDFLFILYLHLIPSSHPMTSRVNRLMRPTK